MAGPRNLLVHRTHAQNLTGGGRHRFYHSSTLELARSFSGAKKLSSQINTDHSIPLFKCHLLEGRVTLKPCVADDHM